MTETTELTLRTTEVIFSEHLALETLKCISVHQYCIYINQNSAWKVQYALAFHLLIKLASNQDTTEEVSNVNKTIHNYRS